MEMSTSVKAVACIFASALTISEILTFELFDIEKVGRNGKILFRQCWPSIADNKTYRGNFNDDSANMAASEMLAEGLTLTIAIFLAIGRYLTVFCSTDSEHRHC